MKLFSESLRERKTRKTKRRTTNDVDPAEFSMLVAESISSAMEVDGFVQQVYMEADEFIQESAASRGIDLEAGGKEVVKLFAEAGFADKEDQGGFKGMVKKVIDFIKKIFNKVVDFIKGLIGKVSNTAKQFKKARNEFQNLIDYLDTQKLPSSAELTYQKADWVGALNYIGGADDGSGGYNAGVFHHSAYSGTSIGAKIGGVEVDLDLIDTIARAQTEVLGNLGGDDVESDQLTVVEDGEVTINYISDPDKTGWDEGSGVVKIYKKDSSGDSNTLELKEVKDSDSIGRFAVMSELLDAWKSEIGSSNNEEAQNTFIAKVYTKHFMDHLKDMSKLEGKSDEDFKEKVKEAVYGEEKDTKTYKGNDITELVTKIWEDGFEALDMSRVIQALEDGKDDFADKAEQFEDAGSEFQSAVDRVEDKIEDADDAGETLSDEIKNLSGDLSEYSAAAGVYQVVLTKSYTFAESFASQISQDLIKLAKKANKVAKDKGSKSDDEGDDS